MKTHAKNILVVDDDPATRQIIQYTVESLGHAVKTAGDGKAAIELFAASPDFFQVVITDHNMPIVNGLDLVQHLRDNHFKGQIIVISGFLTEALITEYVEKQVTKILPRQSDFETFGTTLSDLIDNDN
ncbi:MAG: response regulator [Chthoniobacteraceae bacterium]